MSCNIDSSEARHIASEWHSGQWSALYALSSSGTIQNHSAESEVQKAIASVKARPDAYDTGELERLTDLLDYVTQPITHVWSSHGHTFNDESNGYATCDRCGGEWELIRDDPEDPTHGAYVASNGDQATTCSGDTQHVHGDPGENGHSLDCEDGCKHCRHECNCVLCG